MISRNLWPVAALAAVFCPVAARAEAPYYFNKAGVEREAYVADIAECAELAGGVRVASTFVYSPNIYAQAVGSLFSGIMKGAEERRLERRVERTCMADKGYRRLTIAKDVAQSIRKLEGETRVARLFELAAASTPIGTELHE